ncbi:MAG: dihydrolipoamide succinyltransferase, partial [Boseongicola sp. SB0676_bin_33]|nr:dihydrolipoamide succinyltransferase [Boseongicola sp. SB0676_bin_33]
MSTEVRVPALGESVTEAVVATWFKRPGERVSVDEMLCELETDKVTVEVPAPAAGTLAEIVAEEGATVAPDALLATLSATDGEAPAPAKPDAAPAATAAARSGEGKADGQAVDVMVPALGESVTEATGGKLAVMAAGEGAAIAAEPAAGEAGAAPATERKGEDAPSARKMMAEAGLASDQVSGTGRDGRVMKADVLKAISAPAQPDAPAQETRAPVAVADAAREERVKMTRLRQTIAR